MTRRETRPLTRRRLLAGVGTAIGSVALAGCTDDANTAGDGSDDSGTSGDDPDTDGDDDSTGSDDSDTPDDSDDTGDDSDTPDDDGDDSDDAGDDSGDDGSDGGSDCEGESVHEAYEETDVTITTPDGEELGSVTAAIADTSDTRATGLSETECLPPDRGMLFVYDEPQGLNFWMINMDFGLDIVYIDEAGVITSIHHAGPPDLAGDEDGTEEHHQYAGEGQYVLEVNLGWTTERDIEAGDVVNFDL